MKKVIAILLLGVLLVTEDKYKDIIPTGHAAIVYSSGYVVESREKFCCSQLVWAGYKDVCGIDLNTIAFLGAVHPMELVDSSNTGIIYIK